MRAVDIGIMAAVLEDIDADGRSPVGLSAQESALEEIYVGLKSDWQR